MINTEQCVHRAYQPLFPDVRIPPLCSTTLCGGFPHCFTGVSHLRNKPHREYPPLGINLTGRNTHLWENVGRNTHLWENVGRITHHVHNGRYTHHVHNGRTTHTLRYQRENYPHPEVPTVRDTQHCSTTVRDTQHCSTTVRGVPHPEVPTVRGVPTLRYQP